ncbi:MAG: menaquinol-cytochrome c reductase cytochrome b subunit [Acidimicrobiales bacterium]
MTEVPEHLLKRAAEARERSAAKKGGGSDGTPSAESGGAESAGEGAAQPASAAGGAAAGAGSDSAGKIPAHLLDRTKSAKDAPPTAVAAGGGAVAAAAPPPQPTGPGGHTQRLLTVVKSGSIQDVKAVPQDRVHTWPHLLVVEFVAALFVTGFILVFSVFVNAPLLELANFNETPNPSKAPWYFLGLQELLTMFHPMVAGVMLPGMALFLLILAPYIDKNPHPQPEKRKFAVSVMTVHLMFWAVLVLIGSFFRGPGFNFVFPWVEGLFFEF